MSAAASRVVDFGRMIRFSHSVFALPFALASAAMAGWGTATLGQVALIVVAMVGARSAAMGFNRLADQAYDERNPRTRERELPSGKLGRVHVWSFVAFAAVAFIGASFLLNPLCGLLSPVALVLVFGYSFTKRFTALSHVFLGVALAIAPVGAWLAVRGRFDTVPFLMGFGVLFWVAGFDTIYACQDTDFDRSEGLRSIPARWGIAWALRMARAMHVVAVLFLTGVAFAYPLHGAYLVGVALVALLLLYEHSLVSATDLSRVNAAFFTVNGWISVLYLVATVTALVLGGARATGPGSL